MLVDGLTISAGGGLQIRMLDDARRGPVLPTSPSFGDLWELTEYEGMNPPGIYEFVDSWALRNPSISALSFDVSGSVFGTPNAGDRVMFFVSPRTFEVEASLAGAIAASLTAPTITQEFQVSISRNEMLTNIGLIRFDPYTTTGYFIPAQSSPVKVLRGDILMVFAPFDVDPTFADISFTICGHLTV